MDADVEGETTKLLSMDLDKVPTTDSKEGRKARCWFPISSPKHEVEVETIGGLGVKNPWVLGGGERLLVISQSKMWEVDEGKLVLADSYPSLGNISRPFYYEGAPAVVEGQPDRLFIAVFADGRWEKMRISIKQATNYRNVEEILQVLTIDGTQHVFLQVAKTLFHRVGLPSLRSNGTGRGWDAVGSACSNWQSVNWQGEPVVFVWDDDGLRGFHRDGEAWSESIDCGADFLPGDFLPLPRTDGSMRFAISSMPFSVGIHSMGENELVLNNRFGQGFPFPPRFIAIMFIPYIANMMFPVILAIILSGMMLRHRVSSHSCGGDTAQFASLTRRAFAQIVDGIMLAAGMLPFALYFFSIFDMMESETEIFMFPLYFFGAMAFSFAWSIFLLLIFSFTEGVWGVTPGKWLLGIRVVGTDLKPCGFWRALLRNLLKVVDGFFNFTVGILIVAFTKDWQRVGDMAARTIVVRKT